MNENVAWLLELTIKPGQRSAFEAVMRDMIASAQAEPGTLNYEWWIAADGSACHVYERYRDSGAVMTHLAGFGAKFAERFLPLITPTRFVVYGAPSPAAREALAAFDPLHLAPLAGFSR